jgi:predicted nucleic acid-binding protein
VTALFFPDNTVLVNFAYINRMELLRQLTNGNGRWCATIAQECARSAQITGLEALKQASAIFGSPLRPSPAELVDTYLLRDQMAGPADGRYAHLGEAETITIISARGLSGFLVTDDKNAASAARVAKIPVIDTWYLIRTAVKVEALSTADAWADAQTLVAYKRGNPPCAHGKVAFDRWLTT